jgi:hypothetical protein
MNDEVKTATHSQPQQTQQPPQPQQQPRQPEQPQQLQQPETSLHQRIASLAPAPLLKGEDAKAYDALLKNICDALKPVDTIEEILARDVVDLVWETLRLRRLTAALINERAENPLNSTLAAYGADGRMHREFLRGDALMASALDENLYSVERIGRLAALVEARRIAALRELDRHRAVFADRVRQILPPVEDAEYKVIEGQAPLVPSDENAA